ncbi:paladin [Raphidocelis subcapitata]|uniref:Paladin n=1 Tax=Raphidocelis subcapitata TaxID=307507 RepID=A0A2V0P4J0_9CHLO|nr:paladin [Raphidocelis subcapitata]|eukprot:GBF92770.1 paladin [Raphidocelis subcapitata]
MGEGTAVEEAPALDLAALKAEDVVRERAGDVLLKNTLLKADHFPGCQNMKLTPLLEGAPNFRQVEGLPVYGVAIPTVRGVRNVLDAVGAAKGARRVLWHNLREEPVIYINGKPYVVREADQPFCNLEYTGIDRSRVEDMEQRLKADVLSEAAAFDDHILVTEEDDDMQVIERWEPVTEADVQTPLDVYKELKADGYDVEYVRLPITDEKAPKDSDFEVLVRRLWGVPPATALVFNCQMGRGRTTTGMIIGCLMLLRRMGAFPTPRDGAPAAAAAAAAAAAPTGGGGALPPAPVWFSAAEGPPPADPGDRLRGGLWGVVRSLLRVLESGNLGKAVLDQVVDAAAAMQNLREAIAQYRGRVLAEAKERRRAAMMAVCLEYLERYYMLICFASYLCWSKFDPDSPTHIPFPEWTASRPELRSVLSHMLRRNPMAALEMHVPAATLPPGTPPRALDDEANAHLMRAAEDQAEGIISSRHGRVLGALSILKEDYFPGMKSRRLPQPLPGASNFRRMQGARVYGVAMSTVVGIRNVLNAVREDGVRGGEEELLWFNMREEPVVYVNGRPFVLREQVCPMKNLQEYAGIDATRLERMERRLKEDVLAEAARYGGRILVARESAISGGGSGELIDTWEPVSSPGAVQTPAEVYRALRGEGYRVQYCRVPVTDGRAPAPEDIDVILDRARSHGMRCPMIFNCQLGAGRTTTGTVIAGLVDFYAAAAAAAGGADAAGADGAGAGAGAGVRAISGGGAGAGGAAALLRHSSAGGGGAEVSEAALREALHGGSPRSEDDEREAPALAPGEGGYVGVRRVVRLLEVGDVAKRVADAAIDANAQLLNLRMAILKYHKPRNSYKSLRSETGARHSAFSRGSAYLERYCLLIAVAGYLEQCGPHSATTFRQWLANRPELRLALQSIHTNPAAALAAVPVAAPPLAYRPLAPGGAQVTEAEQRAVLAKRKGRALTRRIILKSYLSSSPDPALPRGTPDVRKADGLAVYTVGNCSVEGLRRLLALLGAGPGGAGGGGGAEGGNGGGCTVVLTDVREELVVYVNGLPYIRRELEMPSAAMHHAGVHWRQLEALEAALKEDVLREAAKWGGRILLHQEFAAGDLSKRGSLTAAPAPSPPPASAAKALLPLLGGSFLTPPDNPLTPQVAHLRAAFASPSFRHAAASRAGDAADAAADARPAPGGAFGGGGGSARSSGAGEEGEEGGAAAEPLAEMSSAAVAAAAAQMAAASVDAATPPGARLPGAGAPSPANGGGAPSPAPAPFLAFTQTPNGGGAAAPPPPLAAPPAGAGAGRPPPAPVTAGAAAAAAAAAAGTPGARQLQGQLSGRLHDDVTALVDSRPGTAVIPFWEPVDLSASSPGAAPAPSGRASAAGAGGSPPAAPPPPAPSRRVLATCRDVAGVLAEEGFRVAYRRIPLSRDRTPVAGDMQDLHAQLELRPDGGPMGGAPGGTAGGTAGGRVIHLVLSRTATGSSARFAAASLCTYLLAMGPEGRLPDHMAAGGAAAAAAAGAAAGASPARSSPAAAAAAAHAHARGLSPAKPGSAAAAAAAAAGPGSPPAKRLKRSMSDLGEYRGIVSVTRLLPRGTDVKGAVDEAIDRCSQIGNLREDIKACKHIAESAPSAASEDPQTAAWAARQLGVHYLKRYFLLIAYRSFLDAPAPASFVKWMEERRELGHLLGHLGLET